MTPFSRGKMMEMEIKRICDGEFVKGMAWQARTHSYVWRSERFMELYISWDG